MFSLVKTNNLILATMHKNLGIFVVSEIPEKNQMLYLRCTRWAPWSGRSCVLLWGLFFFVQTKNLGFGLTEPLVL